MAGKVGFLALATHAEYRRGTEETQTLVYRLNDKNKGKNGIREKSLLHLSYSHRLQNQSISCLIHMLYEYDSLWVSLTLDCFV